MATAMTHTAPTGKYLYAQSPMIYSIYNSNYAQTNFFYKVFVKIWQGEELDIPASITYTLSKSPDSNNVAKFDVSSLVRDYFTNPEFTFSTSGDTTELTTWMQVTLNYTYGTGPFTSADFPLDAVTVLNGYTLYSELSDYLTTGNTWNSITEAYYTRATTDAGGTNTIESLSCIPLSYDARTVSFLTDRPLATTIPSDTSMGMFIGKCGAATRVAISINSGASTKYIYLSSHTAKVLRIGSGTTEVSALFSPTVVTDYQIWAENDGGDVLSSVYSFTVEEPCRYGFKNIQFLNRYGVWDNILFYGSKRENINVKRSEIIGSQITTDSTTDLSFTEQQGQFRMKNISGREDLTINTGWIVEGWNTAMKQLMLTSSIFDADTLQPYTLKDNNLTFKTALNEGLHDYTIRLSQAHTSKNTVY